MNIITNTKKKKKIKKYYIFNKYDIEFSIESKAKYDNN